MANIPLKSIKFPDLPDTYIINPSIAEVVGLQDALDEKADKTDVYNGFVSENIQGSIASFTDGADGIPVKSLVADINPVQSGSGDPSPDNVRAISGWTEANISVTGINLWDVDNIQNGYIDDSNGNVGGISTAYRNTGFISVVPNETYYIITEQTDALWGAWYDANQVYISGCTNYKNTTKTAPANAHYLRLTIKTPNGGNENTFAINYPSTDHDYHAYHGEVYTISFASAGTVYGGVLDVTTGVLTVERVFATIDGQVDGEPRFTDVDQTTTADGSKYVAYIPLSSFGMANNNEMMADSYKYLNVNTTLLHVGQFNAVGSYARFVIADQTLDTLAKLNTFLSSNPLHVVYQLTTPQTYQLTPTEVKTLLKNNNIWADTGDIDLTYRADLGLYLDKIINA